MENKKVSPEIADTISNIANDAPFSIQQLYELKKYLSQKKVNHFLEIKKLQGMKPAIIYCLINRLSSQQFGPLIEKYFIYKYKYKRNPASKCIGDCSKAGENYEVKVSLGGAQHKRFNYVQIRICHDIMQYVLVAYHLTYENVDAGGELYIFKLTKLEMKEVLIQYGGYAHGTKKEHGAITMESLDNAAKKEFAIRTQIGDKCWKALIEFRITEADL